MANNPPTLSGLGDTASYTENGAAVVLDANGNASVSDAELNPPSNFGGARLMLARQGGAVPDDVFSGNGTAAGQLDLTHSNGLGENVSLDGGSSFIGTFSQPGDGTFAITFNSNASRSNIDSVLRQISYANTNDNPPTSVTIDFTFDDGNGLPGGQDQGSGAMPGTATGSVTVNITPTNDAPQLINVAPSAAYVTGTSGVVLSSGLGAFDVDTPSLAGATIQIVSGFLAGDQLFVNLATDAGTGHLKTPDGVVTGISASYTAGTLTLSGSSSIQDYQAVLDAISYKSTAADPTSGGSNSHRTITWTVNDGSLNSQPPNTDPDNLVNATILNFPAAPVLDLDASAAGTGFTTTYNENAAPIAIADTDVSLSYSDGATVTSASVVLTNAATGDSLSIAGTLPGGIASSIDTSVGGQITLLLSGSASLANYQTALGQIRFVNSSDNPNTTDRDITVLVSAGEVSSNVAHAIVHVIAVNDAPVIASNGGGDTATVSIPENTTVVTTVVATDPDSPLTYSIAGGSDAGKFQINSSSGALSFITAPDFEIPGDSDHNNTYVVQVRASDGTLADTQTITVSVGDASDPLPTVHWTRSLDVGPHPAGWLPGGIGDFNGDATSDLAWFNSTTGNVDIWKLSNGQWAGSADVGAHPGGYQPAGFGDFNADGTSDVLWFNATTRDAEVWKIANGQWAGSVDIGTHPAGYSPSGVGDFNHDGTSDVLWYNASTRDAEIWTISNGQWAGSVDVGTHPAGYQPALTGDFNGDGTSDIAWYNSASGKVDIWKLSNGQWAGSVDLGAHPAGWQPLGAADFNLDGTADIAWYNPSTNNIDIWLINNGQWAGSVDLGSHPAGSVAVGVGDFDHNGVGDIMWRNTASNSIENWMLAYS
ncbi:MAG: FG-GAP-like repeat-containing protein [Xanthobacteraceae bacterium]